MTFLSDRTLDHLKEVAEQPNLEHTRYELIDEIARGGMGTIFLAQDRDLDRRVALKVVSGVSLSEDARARLIQEARILARLEHPGIVPVHDVGRLPDGRVFYTMKLVEGERLDEHVSRLKGSRERLRIFEKICEAVAFAHAHGVLHRDLKPGNVMVGPFGEVLVMDWGVAKILGERSRNEVPAPTAMPLAALEEGETPVVPDRAKSSGETLPGTVIGTPGYMAPEQASGRLDLVDRRADVYALGVILDELVGHLDERVPRRLKAVIDKASAPELVDRYRSVEELGRDVSRFLDGEKVSAYRERVGDVLWRWFEKYRGPILLLLTYLVVRALILIFMGT